MLQSSFLTLFFHEHLVGLFPLTEKKKAEGFLPDFPIDMGWKSPFPFFFRVNALNILGKTT